MPPFRVEDDILGHNIGLQDDRADRVFPFSQGDVEVPHGFHYISYLTFNGSPPGAWFFYTGDGSLNKGIWTRGVSGDLPVLGGRQRGRGWMML
jgi:hypothetical protein